MPQATAGQQFGEHVYSYKADATIEQAHQFYISNLKLMATFQMDTPNSGANMHFINLRFSGLDITITSQDSDQSQVTVIISWA